MKKTYLAFAIAASTLFACNTGTNSSNTDSTTNSTMVDSGNSMNTMTSPDTMHAMTTDTTPVSSMDKQFMMEAGAGGNTEVAASKIALERSSNDRIKSFANMMVTDHTKAGDELKSIASAKNVNLPDSVMPPQHQALEMLRKAPSKSFDHEYMSTMVRDHRATVDKFEMAAKKCDNGDVKAFASKTLPVIKMHLDSALAIQKSM